jgi:hypothetical protein
LNIEKDYDQNHSFWLALPASPSQLWSNSHQRPSLHFTNCGV